MTEKLESLGRVPPQAIDLEKAILGAIMLERQAFYDVSEIINHEVFYLDKHKKIFRCFEELDAKNLPIDLLTVCEYLGKTGDLDKVGGAIYVASLTNGVFSSANLITHSRIVLQKYVQNKIISICSEMVGLAYDHSSDAFDLISKMEDGVNNLNKIITNSKKVDVQELAFTIIKQLNLKSYNGRNNIENPDDIYTWMPEWDKVNGALFPGLYIIAARPAMGKCLGLGTKVAMYNGGFKNVENVVKGDLLMGPDSKPRRVLSITKGTDKMYWVRQNKGIDYRVNSCHILSLKRSRTEWKHKNGDVLNINIQDWINSSAKFKTNYKGYKVGVEYKEVGLRLSPYFMGVWIGDGDKANPAISNVDKEVVDYLSQYAESLGMILSERKYSYRTCPSLLITNNDFNSKKENKISTALRYYGILNSKDIPDDYIYNSRKNRLEFLAGVLDTDGYYLEKYNGYEITQKHKHISEKIKIIADSLGFRTSIKKKRAKITKIGFEGDVYKVFIFGDVQQIPCIVEKRKARESNTNHSQSVTGIKVEYDCVDDYYGFELDGDGLFLLEDYTVTHNTNFMVELICRMGKRVKVGVVNGEMTNQQLLTRIGCNLKSIDNILWKKQGEFITDAELELVSDAMSEAINLNIVIDDHTDINRVVGKIKTWVRQEGVKVVLVDVLSKFKVSEGKKRYMTDLQETNYVVNQFSDLARDFKVPIILFAHLNRELYKRGSKEPVLSDLKGSGNIEDFAYQVSFLHRPEYYEPNVIVDENGQNIQGLMYQIIAKHRDGSLARLKHKALLSKSQIREWDDYLELNEDTPF